MSEYKIIINNPEQLDIVKGKISDDGPDKVHVLSDFDRTLTKGKVQGQKINTIIAQLREGNYLTPDYPVRAHALYDKYYPFECDYSLSKEERSKLMDEWWKTHFDLLVECGLNRDIMKKVVEKRNIQFRDGAIDFFNSIKKLNIPLVIMSASIGDMINMYLNQDSLLSDNVHVIANLYNFDQDGLVVSMKGNIIHALNKYEILLKDQPFFSEVKERKSVIILGDSVDDIGMVEGFKYNNLIKIGFLNSDSEHNLPEYQKAFDIVIVSDDSMEEVNSLMREIFDI